MKDFQDGFAIGQVEKHQYKFSVVGIIAVAYSLSFVIVIRKSPINGAWQLHQIQICLFYSQILALSFFLLRFSHTLWYMRREFITQFP